MALVVSTWAQSHHVLRDIGLVGVMQRTVSYVPDFQTHTFFRPLCGLPKVLIKAKATCLWHVAREGRTHIRPGLAPRIESGRVTLRFAAHAAACHTRRRRQCARMHSRRLNDTVHAQILEARGETLLRESRLAARSLSRVNKFVGPLVYRRGASLPLSLSQSRPQ